MTEMILRFVIGGVIVSAFAVISEMFRPKSFAGLFNAAPSIALATLGITIAQHGKLYASTQCRSMMLGAAAFLLYAAASAWLLLRFNWKAITATVALIPVWLATSFALWWAIWR